MSVADSDCSGWSSRYTRPAGVLASASAQEVQRDASASARPVSCGPLAAAKKARRWVVEVCHSWFNRFRKLLVRYEKLERSFVALNHIAAGIIAFRKIKLTVNIIYG